MIGFLKGTLFEKKPDHVLLLVNGVGYQVEVPASSLCQLPSLNHETSLFIYTHVREDAIRLFGFIHSFDKLVFDSLLQVSGIGPKAALALLGAVDGFELCDIIINQQVARLTSTPGIGAKTAERVVLELKNKCQKLLLRYQEERPNKQTTQDVLFDDSSALESSGQSHPKTKLLRSQMVDDLKSALTNLGYKEKQFTPAVEHVVKKMQTGEDFSFEVAFKQVLKALSEHVFKN